MSSMSEDPKNRDEASKQEADRILTRVERESEIVGRSSTKRMVDDMSKHFSGADANQNDWAEVWGTRIGRGLGAIFFIGLSIYLLQTYVF